MAPIGVEEEEEEPLDVGYLGVDDGGAQDHGAAVAAPIVPADGSIPERWLQQLESVLGSPPPQEFEGQANIVNSLRLVSLTFGRRSGAPCTRIASSTEL